MVRIGVIGTNWISEAFMQAAAAVQDLTCTAVCSRTEERGRAFAAKYGIERTFTDAESMAKSGVVDAVYIATPNAFHARHAIACMRHGIHVLCEKPLASNEREALQMMNAAEKFGVTLMEAVKSTVMPSFQGLKEHLPKIGQVRRYFAAYCQYSSRYDAYRQGTVLNAFKPELSNGALMDLGLYCIYPLIALFGEPSRVKAAGVMLDSGVDGEGSLLLQYERMDAVVMYSKITNSSLHSEIQGEDGVIVIDKISEPRHLETRYRDGRFEFIGKPAHELAMRHEIEEFVQLVRTGRRESAINSFAVSLGTMRVMDEARRQLGLVYPADRE